MEIEVPSRFPITVSSLLNIINAEIITYDECVRRIGESFFIILPVIIKTTPKNEKPNDFEENIFEAAKQSNLSSIKHHIEECNVNAETRNKNQRTLLIFALLGGHIEVISFLNDEYYA